MQAWLPPQQLGFADGLPYGGRFGAGIAAGPGGDALYVEGAKQNLVPTMTFSARGRAAGAASYGGPIALSAGQPGEARVAPLAAGRFLVLVRSGAGLFSRAGSTATGFADPLVLSGTDAAQILGLAGAPSGRAAAAWVTTTGAVDAAIYDDSLRPPSPPPPAAADSVAPVLSRLAVSPRRFAVRRRAHGTRIRWRLSEPALVTLRVDRIRRGFKRGGRCVAHRPKSSHVRRCRRLVRNGTLARTAAAGGTTRRFDGSVRGRALRPGRYRLTAIARDAAGNRSRPERTGFIVARR